MGTSDTYEMPIRVRYAECDPMGIAHHSSFAIWLEMGRTERLRRDGLNYRDLEDDGVFLAVIKLAITYKRPARYDDELIIETTLDKMSQVKIEHSYRVMRGTELLATGVTVLACIDAAGRPQRLPESLQATAQRRLNGDD